MPPQGQETEVVLSGVTGTYKSVRAAVYWMDPASEHHDVDITLVAPDGQTVGSCTWDSIFEKAMLTNVAKAGQWKLRIRSYSRTSTSCSTCVFPVVA